MEYYLEIVLCVQFMLVSVFGLLCCCKAADKKPANSTGGRQEHGGNEQTNGGNKMVGRPLPGAQKNPEHGEYMTLAAAKQPPNAVYDVLPSPGRPQQPEPKVVRGGQVTQPAGNRPQTSPKPKQTGESKVTQPAANKPSNVYAAVKPKPKGSEAAASSAASGVEVRLLRRASPSIPSVLEPSGPSIARLRAAHQANSEKNVANYSSPIIQKHKSDPPKSEVAKAKDAYLAKQAENIESNYYAPMLEKHKQSKSEPKKSDATRGKESYQSKQSSGKTEIEKARAAYQASQATRQSGVEKAREAYKSKQPDNISSNYLNKGAVEKTKPATSPLRPKPEPTGKDIIAKAREAHQAKQAENIQANYFPGFGPNKVTPSKR